MPITCRICGATNKHWTAQCPDRPDAHPSDSSQPEEQQKGLPKGSGNNGRSDGRGKGGKGVDNRDGDRRQHGFTQIAQQAVDRNRLPWIEHACSGEEAPTRRFMRIRPSAVDWNQFGILYAGRECIGIAAKLLSEFQGLRVASEWEKLTRQRDLSRTDLEHGLKQLSARHRMRKGKWLFYLPPPDTDRVWPELVWALSSGALGEAHAVTVGPTGDQGDYLCCVYMDNCFDPSEAESVRNSLQALLSGLVTNDVLHLKPDIYAHCQIHRGNPWNLPPTLATCKMQGFKDKTLQVSQAPPHPCRHDREQLTPLLQAVEGTMETAPLLLEKAQARAMLESLHAVALHPSAGDFPIIKMCAVVKESGHIHGLLRFIGFVIRGLVGLDGIDGIWGYSSCVFTYSEFMRMHLANAHLLGNLCIHDIIPAETVYVGLRKLDTDRPVLPLHSTWAFVLQIMRNISRQLSEAKPKLSRRLETIVNSHPAHKHQLRVLTFNVWFDETERELRTAALLCALQAAGAGHLLLPGGDPQGGHRHPTCASHLDIFGSWRWVLN
eukprot:s3200_g4.t1